MKNRLVLTKISPDIKRFKVLPSLLFQYFHEVIQLKVSNLVPFLFHCPVLHFFTTVVDIKVL